MADLIKCPVCGKNNPDGKEFCQYCKSPLQNPAASNKNTDSSFTPGQAPTKKNTAELEPILPQWLRDARDSARTADKEAQSQAAQKPEQKTPGNSSEDFLAGLRSQSDDNEDDETPDWLASITGAAPKPKKAGGEITETRRVELGGKGDFAQDEPENDSDTPSWMAGLTANESQANEKDELTDWFRNADDSKLVETPKAELSFDETFSTASSEDNAPDWLRQMSADEEAKKEPLSSSFDTTFNESQAESSETPDWLRQMAADAEVSDEPQASSLDIPSSAASTSDADTPDWLRQMAAGDNSIPSASSVEAPSDAADLSIDVPDWLRGIEDKPQSAAAPVDTEPGSSKPKPPALVSTGELPSWLNDQVDSAPKPTQDTTPKWLKKDAPASVTGELPAWLSASEETVRLPSTPKDTTPASDAPVQEDGDDLGGMPDWLKAAAPISSIFEQPTAAPSEPAPVEDSSTDTPDWLSAFKTLEEPQPEPSSTVEKDAPFADDMSSAFAGELGLSSPKESGDDLFAEMPAWLSNAMELPPSNTPTPITNTDAIAPGELPSWVQAMRPVDAALPNSIPSSSFSSDQTLESRGALAGLQGVLPSVPGFTPTSKPKAYSIRLQASEEQQAHAELLEQILAAETAPVPIASFSALRTSRSLRWFLFILIFAAVTFGMMPGTLFSLPLGVPREVSRAADLSRSLPQGAPVLVAFDLEASRVGEVEAAAAPFFDQMIFYSHPNLTFISTSETGSLLAERFVAGPLADHYKNSGFTYSNLGYLPGGQLGIRDFVQNPRGTAQLDMYLQPAWASAPDNLNSLSELFMAMILVTDNADSARAWIEQTESAQNSLPVIVISSAQAAPMIQPYFESQQVNGMVAGLYGAAVFEQNYPGSTQTAKTYWDAYSLGMLLAVALVVGGGLWNLILGLRDRSSVREAK